MPTRARKPCKHAGCPNAVLDGYCAKHEHERPTRKPDERGSASSRGYGNEWRKVRGEVLRASGIPFSLWRFYDVDHNPPYDPAREPDHRKYQLTPRLHGAHSRKTVMEDGGFGRERATR